MKKNRIQIKKLKECPEDEHKWEWIWDHPALFGIEEYLTGKMICKKCGRVMPRPKHDDDDFISMNRYLI